MQTAAEFCPLCGTALHSAQPNTPLPMPQNTYPDLSGAAAKYNLMFRLLLFFTLLGAGISVLVNWLVTPSFLWCLIVVAALAYLWLTVPPYLRRGVNYAKRIMYQALFTSALAVALDFIIGYRGWSVSYVIPSLLDAAIAAVWLMVVFNRTNWAQYIFYQMVIGTFGLVPLVLYLLGFAQNLPMVLVTAGLALASLLISLVFGDKTLKNDFRRRFHL
ncbi:DUF6320 domain-containing protein [Ruminococcaceae bacterium OttesenSCG-928-A11]|nr:DUF6320 domain-containing protein [Ruminococcaceae bacterium OttesenSCG-928-A11]